MRLHHIEPTELTPPKYGNTNVLVCEDEAVVGESVQSAKNNASQLSAELSRETRKFRRSIVRVITGAVLLEAGAIALRGVLTTGMRDSIVAWSQIPAHLLFSASLSLGLVATPFIVNSGLKPRRHRRALARKVAHSSDVRSIGSLIDAMQLDDGQTRELVVTALIDLLPRVTEADSGCVTPSQRARLYRKLNTPVENVLHKDIRALFQPAADRAVAFRVAILQALPVVGDEEGRSIAQRLAESDAKTDGESRIRDAARQCLPALEKRLEALRTSQTLLRPSEASSDGKNTLLRADVMESEHDPGQLLRKVP